MVSVRRILWLVFACLVAASAYTVWTRRRAETAAPVDPVWPPFAVDDGHLVPAVVPMVEPATPDAGSAVREVEPATSDVTWVAPVDGTCPDGYPVKAKASSGIYHVPGGRFYDRTVPDRCYADPAAAEADGYRASKS